MTDIFIDTRTIGAWAQQPADELLWQYVTRQLGLGVGGTIKAYSDLSIYLYIAGKLDSTGPRKSPCLIPSTVSLVTAVLCGCHGDVCISRHWSLSPRYGGAMGGMSWSLVILAAPASDSVLCAVTSAHLATLCLKMNT